MRSYNVISRDEEEEDTVECTKKLILECSDIWGVILNYLMLLDEFEYIKVLYMMHCHKTWKRAIYEGLTHLTVSDAILFYTDFNICNFVQLRSLKIVSVINYGESEYEFKRNREQLLSVLFSWGRSPLRHKIESFSIEQNKVLNIDMLKMHLYDCPSIKKLTIKSDYDSYSEEAKYHSNLINSETHTLQSLNRLTHITLNFQHGFRTLLESATHQELFGKFNKDIWLINTTHSKGEDIFKARTGNSIFLSFADETFAMYIFKGFLQDGKRSGAAELEFTRTGAIYHVHYDNDNLLLDDVKIIYKDSTVYQGSINKEFKPHAVKGSLVKKDDYTLSGLFVGGKFKSGVDTRKDYQYTGEFDDDGNKDGKAELFFFQSKERVFLSHDKGVPSDRIIIHFQNGDIYEGSHLQYIPHGRGKLKMKDGDVQKGLFENGEFAKGKFITNNGKDIYHGNFTRRPKFKGYHYVRKSDEPELITLEKKDDEEEYSL
jgi:hypothetical protein